MNDWRIIEDEESYWKGKPLLKISFPEFWQQAYAAKNRFFAYVFAEAQQHIALLGQEESCLEGERCRAFWHRHCDFCTKEITTDAKETCYCSVDGVDWICEDCFNDFRQRFAWKTVDAVDDIPIEGFVPLQLTKA